MAISDIQFHLLLVLLIDLADTSDVFLTFGLMMAQKHVLLLLDVLATLPLIVVHAASRHFALLVLLVPAPIVVVEALTFLLVVPLIGWSEFEIGLLRILFATSILIQQHPCDELLLLRIANVLPAGICCHVGEPREDVAAQIRI